jgi:hypothetical protein
MGYYLPRLAALGSRCVTDPRGSRLHIGEKHEKADGAFGRVELVDFPLTQDLPVHPGSAGTRAVLGYYLPRLAALGSQCVTDPRGSRLHIGERAGHTVHATSAGLRTCDHHFASSAKHEKADGAFGRVEWI